MADTPISHFKRRLDSATATVLESCGDPAKSYRTVFDEYLTVEESTILGILIGKVVRGGGDPFAMGGAVKDLAEIVRRALG